MKKKIIVLPGDGIGPEVINQSIKVAEAINQVFEHKFEFTTELIGAVSIDAKGSPLTEDVIEKCKESDAILLGAIGSPKYDNDPTLKIRPEQGLLELRKSLSLYANVRPINIFNMSKTSSPLKENVIEGVDIEIYRELTGGLYFGDKVKSTDGKMASDSCTYTTEEIERIAKLAFESAQNRKKKVTLVDKANVLETSRLWRSSIQKISSQYPEIDVDYMFVDNAAMQLMINPRQFDVILTENLFGDIISDQASVITGSLGMIPSSSIGIDTAMFEPIHGSFPQAAGKDIANPFATILSLAMMYDYFKLYSEAETIRKAVDWAISENIVTQDINPKINFKCSKIGDLLSDYICKNEKLNFHPKDLVFDDYLN